MDANYLLNQTNKHMEAITLGNKSPGHDQMIDRQLKIHEDQIKKQSDSLMNYILACMYLAGFALAPFYNTWLVAFGIGTLSLLAYYSVKFLLPQSNLYQYVLSAVFGIFMAQYIYQMHGLFEMHFIAFIGSAILITYQNWKLQFPLMIVVTVHHAIFGYLQYLGNSHIYFTQLEYMDLQTFIIHVTLAAAVFFICGLWAYNLRKNTNESIAKTYQIVRLQEETKQKELLEAANEELKKSNYELDKFVYSVSHDLRAPLASMKGIVELSIDDTQDERLLNHFNLLSNNIEKLDGFILDILEYSRNTRAEIKQENINFQEITDDIINNLKYMNGSNEKIEISVDINQEEHFFSDKSRLNIILANLISNAIRYQNTNIANRYIKIMVETDSPGAKISISDNGIGIKKELQEKIFDMFYRVSSKSSGSGLGLYIVKEAIAKLSGEINIISELNMGTEFRIFIPNARQMSE